MVEMKRMAAALALALSLSLSGAAAEEAKALWRAVVAVEALGIDPGSAERYASSLAYSLSRSPEFIEVMKASGPDPVAAEAGRLGYDLGVGAKVEPTEAGIRVSWKIFWATNGRELDSGGFEAGKPDEKDLAGDFWSDLVIAAEKSAEEAGPLGSASLRVTGPPGAIVRGLGKEAVTIPAEGSADLVAKAPATYSWRASAKGYYDAAGVAEVFEPRSELRIDLMRQRPWTLELGLLNGAFPDFWASRRFLDDRIFLRVGLYQYLGGIALGNVQPGYDPDVLLSTSLVQPGLGAGWIFGKNDAPTRAYAGLTATTRIAFPQGAGIFIDPVAPLCLEPYAGIEWKALDRWGFFAELGADVYVLADGFLLAASIGSRNGPAGYSYGADWLVQFPSLRFGTRFYL
jgi:hypothetical protein